MRKTTLAMEMRRRFGALMMDARKARGFTLEEVARKGRTHKGYVSAVERGKAPIPRPKIVRRWAKALGVPIGQALAYRQLSDIPEDLPLADVANAIECFEIERAAAVINAPAPVEKAG